MKRRSAFGLRPRIWPHLLRLVTKAMSDRLLGRAIVPIVASLADSAARQVPPRAPIYAGRRPPALFKKRDWLICLWRSAADVFVQDAGYQALIGQAFLGGSPLQHFKVGGR